MTSIMKRPFPLPNAARSRECSRSREAAIA
jgi:hypothetical protein